MASNTQASQFFYVRHHSQVNPDREHHAVFDHELPAALEAEGAYQERLEDLPPLEKLHFHEARQAALLKRVETRSRSHANLAYNDNKEISQLRDGTQKTRTAGKDMQESEAGIDAINSLFEKSSSEWSKFVEMCVGAGVPKEAFDDEWMEMARGRVDEIPATGFSPSMLSVRLALREELGDSDADRFNLHDVEDVLFRWRIRLSDMAQEKERLASEKDDAQAQASILHHQVDSLKAKADEISEKQTAAVEAAVADEKARLQPDLQRLALVVRDNEVLESECSRLAKEKEAWEADRRELQRLRAELDAFRAAEGIEIGTLKVQKGALEAETQRLMTELEGERLSRELAESEGSDLRQQVDDLTNSTAKDALRRELQDEMDLLQQQVHSEREATLSAQSISSSHLSLITALVDSTATGAPIRDVFLDHLISTTSPDLKLGYFQVNMSFAAESRFAPGGYIGTSFQNQIATQIQILQLVFRDRSPGTSTAQLQFAEQVLVPQLHAQNIVSAELSLCYTFLLNQLRSNPSSIDFAIACTTLCELYRHFPLRQGWMELITRTLAPISLLHHDRLGKCALARLACTLPDSQWILARIDATRTTQIDTPLPDIAAQVFTTAKENLSWSFLVECPNSTRLFVFSDSTHETIFVSRRGGEWVCSLRGLTITIAEKKSVSWGDDPDDRAYFDESDGSNLSQYLLDRRLPELTRANSQAMVTRHQGRLASLREKRQAGLGRT